MRVLPQGRILGVIAAFALLLIASPAVDAAPASSSPIRLIGSLGPGGEATGKALGVSVADGFAYVAAGPSIWIVDVSSPASPRLVSTVAARDSAQDICVAGGFAFVADSDSGLTVIDVSNPASPVIVGSLDTPWSAEKIEVGS
ncbi:MAG TPA: hypothetical protein VMU02_02250, partial [bacterium]|nr:hypothetical protein [bacterium]